jgi:hypothetical protein
MGQTSSSCTGATNATLERLLRETYNYAGTPIKFSFRDEKQVKSNKERVARGLATSYQGLQTGQASC